MSSTNCISAMNRMLMNAQGAVEEVEEVSEAESPVVSKAAVTKAAKAKAAKAAKAAKVAVEEVDDAEEVSEAESPVVSKAAKAKAAKAKSAKKKAAKAKEPMSARRFFGKMSKADFQSTMCSTFAGVPPLLPELAKALHNGNSLCILPKEMQNEKLTDKELAFRDAGGFLIVYGRYVLEDAATRITKLDDQIKAVLEYAKGDTKAAARTAAKVETAMNTLLKSAMSPSLRQAIDKLGSGGDEIERVAVFFRSAMLDMVEKVV
jgi:hypothetical protein